MTELREQAREALHVYMSRTGLSLGNIAARAGYSHRTMLQLVSSARFGNREDVGDTTARRLLDWLQANPAPFPELPGKLYETAATAEMDRLLAHAQSGGWGILYGPAGAQKSFLLEYRAAQAARAPQPGLALVQGDTKLSPRAILARIAQAIAAPYAHHTESLREAVLTSLRRREQPVGLVIDEAQLLYREVETLETLRRLGDQSRGRLGLVVAGNEQVTELFDPRRRTYFEQWRSRIDQRAVRVLGPSKAEARVMIAGELGTLQGPAAETLIERCLVPDPVSKRQYVSARRLFHAMRDFRDILDKSSRQ